MYKPISLCSMIYKTITKIASNRLKTILPNLIGLTQISFVLRQNITENIIIAQEIIHNMLQKKGKRGQILIKVDLEKAYDCLSWSFIREPLCEVRLPAGLICFIMYCISLVTMQILWNGQCTSRGIRQGDLFSPYIFVLCIERQLPGLTVRSKAVVGSPFTFLAEVFPSPISSFLDDLLLFAEASCDQATVIHEVLYSFCDISDENVNNKKTQFFFSP